MFLSHAVVMEENDMADIKIDEYKLRNSLDNYC
jgi:hypothetical protein